MYIACDTPDCQVVTATLVGQIQRRRDLNWMGLVDGAFDYRRKPLKLSEPPAVIYHFDEMESLIDASPYLVGVQANNQQTLQCQASKLIRHRGCRPMLSFIGSKLTMSELTETWHEFLSVQTSDDQAFVLRFADTRVLPALSHCLESDLWDRFTTGVDEWIYIDRLGHLRNLKLNPRKSQRTKIRRLKDTEFSALMETCEPDAIVDIIVTNNPEVSNLAKPGIIHDRIVAAREMAKLCRIDSYKDIIALATLVIVTNGAALMNKPLLEFLRNGIWPKGNLVDVLFQFA